MALANVSAESNEGYLMAKGILVNPCPGPSMSPAGGSFWPARGIIRDPTNENCDPLSHRSSQPREAIPPPPPSTLTFPPADDFMRCAGEKLRILQRGRRWGPSSRSLSHGPISLAGELRLAEEVRAILDAVPDAIEPLLDPLAPLLTPHVVSAVLSDVVSPAPAYRFFVWASRRKHLRSWAAHNRVIALLSAAPDDAWLTLDHLRCAPPAPPPPPPAFDVLISAYAAQGRTDRAVESFQRMATDFGSRPSTFTFNTLMRALVAEGISLLAQSLFSQMLKADCRPNAATFAILIDGLCKDGNTDDALNLFDEMSRRRIPPTAVVYTVVLAGLCRAGRLADAERLLQSMARAGVQPDAAAYNAFLDGVCKGGGAGKAMALVSELRSGGLFAPGLYAHSSLLAALFRAGEFAEARRCYAALHAEGLLPDRVLYTIMIKGSAAAGRLREAFSWLREMTERGIAPDTVCYNTLIKCLCDAGQLDRARTLVGEIPTPDAATYTILISGLCGRGLVQEAQTVFDKMVLRGCTPTVATFNALIRGLCRAGQLEQARHLLYQMEMGSNQKLFLRLSRGPNASELGADDGALRRMVESLCDAGRLVEAYKLLRGLADAGAVPDLITYNTLIHGFCQAKNMPLAAALFREMRLKGYAADAVTYTTLATGYLRAGEPAMAGEVFRHMVRHGIEPVLPVYRTIAHELCRTGRVWQAVSLWLVYRSSGSREDELVVAARQRAEQGAVGEAVRRLLASSAGDGRPPYGRWLAGLCRAGQEEEAYAVVCALWERRVIVGAPASARLIQSFCRGGKTRWAMQVMDQALAQGTIFARPVGNRLLKFLWDMDKRQALKLAARMVRAGYALDHYLRKPMKLNLSSYGLLPLASS
ncbi:pentatricopeptide repeat (PPR) superfamily protein [Wolffia australiana]